MKRLAVVMIGLGILMLVVGVPQELLRYGFRKVSDQQQLCDILLLGLLMLCGGIVLRRRAKSQTDTHSPNVPEGHPQPPHGLRSVRGSLIGAIILLLRDGVLNGTFLTAFIVCPVWLLVSVVKNVIQRPGWRVALVRIAIPSLTFAMLFANSYMQWRIAEAHAQRIVKACAEFQAANQRYPRVLDELVPRYLDSVPRARYCFIGGNFTYLNSVGSPPMMFWWKLPPFVPEAYDFEKRRWRYVDGG
jgi:hypothetical protein